MATDNEYVSKIYYADIFKIDGVNCQKQFRFTSFRGFTMIFLLVFFGRFDRSKKSCLKTCIAAHINPLLLFCEV